MIIQNEEQYKMALKEIEPYFDMEPEVKPDTAEGNKLLELADAIEEYEKQHYPMT